MADNFDPYYKWLGIPPKDQPPHHYRLLGIELFEPDREVIDAAANRLMGYLKELASGDDASHSQKLLNEISRARLCLLNKEKKVAYDRELKEKLQAEEEKSAARPTEIARPPQAPPSFFPAVAEPPAFAAPRHVVEPPKIEIGPPSSRSEGRLKPPPLKVRGSPAPAVPEDHAQSPKEETEDEAGRTPGVQRSPKTMLYVSAIGAAAVVATAAIVGTILLRPSPVDDSLPKTPQAKDPVQVASDLTLVTLVLTDQERTEVTAFLVDDQPQPLPPSVELRLPAGPHHIILRRNGYEEVSAKFTLVKGLRQRQYQPRWKREAAKAPVASESPVVLPPLINEAKPIPPTTDGMPVPVPVPSVKEEPKPPPEPTPGPTAPPSPAPASDAEVQAAIAHGFSSGFGQIVAAWLFNGDASDHSGLRHDGVAFGASGTPSYVAGRVGTGLQFTPDLRFEVADALLNKASEFSLAVWVNLASLPAADQPLINGETTAIYVPVGFPRVEIGGGKPLAGPNTVPDTGAFRGVDLSSSPNAWVHLGFVYSARLRQVHYYLNGEHRGCQQYADAAPVTWNRTVITGLSGVLDELRVFNYRLSNGDVKSVYDGTYQPPPAAPKLADGVLECETWFDVPPAESRRDVENLLRGKPDTTSTIEENLSYLAPVGAGERMDRIQGFLFPPAVGDYTFLLQSSGRATLFLHRSLPLEDTLQAVLVSKPHEAATSPRISLEAGKPCYFEILHFYKGDVGGSLRLGWRLPGSADRLDAIAAEHFSSCGAADGKERAKPAP